MLSDDHRFTGSPACFFKKKQADKPNNIFLLADNMRYNIIPFSGHFVLAVMVLQKGLATEVAPPIVGSKRLAGDKNIAINILLHGLTGSIEGKTYPR